MHTSEPITSAVAGAAVTSPLWLHAVADWAALVLPILGAVWLLVQIYAKIVEVRRGRR